MTDILLDIDGDLLIKDGDIAVGESWAQSAQLCINAAPGHFKNAPLIGANVRLAQNGIMNQFVLQRIAVHLEAAGLKASSIIWQNEQLYVNE